MQRMLLIALAVAPLAAQTATPRPAFEVASIKVNTTAPPQWGGEGPPPPPPPPAVRPNPTGLSVIYASLKHCMTWAYNVRPWQIEGPEWIDGVRYDITGKTSAPVTTDELRLMMQQLLTERLRMTIRQDKRETRVMALVVGKNGHRLTPGDPAVKPSMMPAFNRGAIRSTYKNSSLDVLEGFLSSPGWDPVVNMTGLQGGFNFVYERPARDSANPDSWFSDIQASLDKQLGLRLEPRRAPLTFYVIEKAEQKPIQN